MSSVGGLCRKASCLHLGQRARIRKEPSLNLKAAGLLSDIRNQKVVRAKRKAFEGLFLPERSFAKRGLKQDTHSVSTIGSKHRTVCHSSQQPSDQVVEVPEGRLADKDVSGARGGKAIRDQIAGSNWRKDAVEDRNGGSSNIGTSGTEIHEARASISQSQSWLDTAGESTLLSSLGGIGETLLLISPFFFWGTAMVAMKEVLPKAGPLFVAATRLLPAGAMLIGFCMFRGKSNPNTAMAWLAVALFALVDGTMFQGFLAQGLSRTSAGLGSVIIDSQPLTVALLAALLFGETIGPLGALGLATGVLGLCLLEVPEDKLVSLFSLDWLSAPSEASLSLSTLNPGGLWESGEWWMLLAAQSMAVGTVMVRWVSKYVDPVVATGWHMLLGGVPLLLMSAAAHEPAVSGHFADLDSNDFLALLYTSVFGCAVSYGVFFYNASRGNLTKLSSLTFLTPMFAAFFGYLYLGETLSQVQLGGAAVTLAGIYLVNFRSIADSSKSE